MRSETQTAVSKVLVILGVLAIALLIGFSPIEDSAAYIVALLTGGSVLIGLSLVKDPAERATLIRLFCMAFILRLAFTWVAYRTGVIKYLGGADDTGWEACWTNSRFWRGWIAHPPTRRNIPGMSLPETFWDIYNGSRPNNMGFYYFTSYGYYLLNIPSQMATSFFNCGVNALTVVFIYKTAREFFAEKASYFAALVAVILPGFLIWSALSIKEPWVILFEIAAFYGVCRFNATRNSTYLLPVLVLAILIFGLRFYVAYFVIAGTLLSAVCWRAERPFRTAVYGVLGLLCLFGMAMAVHVVHFDLSHIAAAQVAEMDNFRNGASGKNAQITSGGAGAASGVQLDYDISTPSGAIMMLTVGSIYLMLSPFPWQVANLRQAAALPDVFLWWVLVFGFIVPGLIYTYRTRPALLLSLGAFTMPLILIYSLIFGNVGLAYRQRAQLMPFLLILAAAGYEQKHKLDKKRAVKSRFTPLLRQKLRAMPVPTSTIT